MPGVGFGRDGRAVEAERWVGRRQEAMVACFVLDQRNYWRVALPGAGPSSLPANGDCSRPRADVDELPLDSVS